MTLYLCRTKAHHEFEVQQAAQAEGINCMVARQVELRRIGRDQIPRIVERPYWPTYAFCDLDAHQFYQWLGLRYVTQPIVPVQPFEANQIRETLAQAEEEGRDERRKLEAEEQLSEFREGERVKIEEGPFAGLFARFSNAVKYSDGPRLKLEVDAFGRVVDVEAQPIHIRRAAE